MVRLASDWRRSPRGRRRRATAPARGTGRGKRRPRFGWARCPVDCLPGTGIEVWRERGTGCRPLTTVWWRETETVPKQERLGNVKEGLSIGRSIPLYPEKLLACRTLGMNDYDSRPLSIKVERNGLGEESRSKFPWIPNGFVYFAKLLLIWSTEYCGTRCWILRLGFPVLW